MARDAKEVEKMGEAFRKEFGSLVGKTVKGIVALSDKDIEAMAWDPDYDDEAFGIVFTDGTLVVPMSDPEGNGPGFLFMQEAE
jgi:hypothetical protein